MNEKKEGCDFTADSLSWKCLTKLAMDFSFEVEFSTRI